MDDACRNPAPEYLQQHIHRSLDVQSLSQSKLSSCCMEQGRSDDSVLDPAFGVQRTHVAIATETWDQAY
eukprot:6203414-Pleurochrysis_carterae.AAC.2